MSGYETTLPHQLERITLLIPPDSALPIVVGQSERVQGGIEAWYTREQLHDAVWTALAIEIGNLEQRLERGSALIAQARQSEDAARLTRMERHWIVLLERYTALLDALAEIGA